MSRPATVWASADGARPASAWASCAPSRPASRWVDCAVAVGLGALVLVGPGAYTFSPLPAAPVGSVVRVDGGAEVRVGDLTGTAAIVFVAGDLYIDDA